MFAKISGRLTVKSSLLTFVYGLGSWIHLNKVGPPGGTFHQKKQGVMVPPAICFKKNGNALPQYASGPKCRKRRVSLVLVQPLAVAVRRSRAKVRKQKLCLNTFPIIATS